MKTMFKIVAVLIFIILALVIALPFIFQGKITELAKEEVNKNIDAEVDFSSIRLSLFKSFPNFNLGINQLVVVGKGAFDEDTLVMIPSLNITLDLFSVIKGNTYTVKRVSILNPLLNIQVLEDGRANYDITASSEVTEEPASTPEEETGAFTLNLQAFQISKASIQYTDLSTGMQAQLNGLDFLLSGNMTADQTVLKTTMDIAGLDFTYDGIPYFSNTNVSYKADIDADLKNGIYNLKKNSLFLNELLLEFDGSVSMVDDNPNIIMTFKAPITDFKHFLSLIPTIYTRDYASLKASGKLAIDGHIKGMYTESSLPAFSLGIQVTDGGFQYPDLPAGVEEVNILAGISNKGGDADNTVIDISKLHLVLGSNPVDIQLNVKTPVSDPYIKAKINGKVDLAGIHAYYPLEPEEKLSGSLLANVTLDGKLSAIENENYESFTAIGNVLVQNVEYNSSYTRDPVVITNAQLNFSPQYLDLVTLSCKIGKNDIQAKGTIENYLAYTFQDKTLSGKFSTRSNYLDLNQLLPDEEADSIPADMEEPDASMESGVVEIPGNIDFEMNSSFNTLIYDNLTMENVNGKLTIRDKKLLLNNLSMNILDGEMVVSGVYDASDLSKPAIDFNLDLRQLDIQQAGNAFELLGQYAPIAKKTTGKLSSSMKLKGLLDNDMNLVYESLIGGGKLETSKLGIQQVNTLDKLAEVLKYEQLKTLSIEKILLLFDFVDGKILVEPFDLKANEFTGEMAGWTGLDQSIEYSLNMNIPRKSFGSDANQVLNNLVSQANAQGANFSLGETVALGVLIAGTLSDPEIKTNLKEMGSNVMEDVKQQVQEEIQKQKEELTRQAREEAQKIIDDADAQAKKLIAEAEKQAENIRNTAKDAAKKVRDEADKQAKAVEAEGKKKGFLAEAAAKETAKQMRKEADKQGSNIESEADKQATDLVNKAKNEAAALRQKAQEEADKKLKTQ